MSTPLFPATAPSIPDPGAEPLIDESLDESLIDELGPDESSINDPGNEDPGSIEEDARVPLIEDDDRR